MEIIEVKKQDTLIYTIKGSLDPNTSEELIQKIKIDNIKEVIFDIKDVDYVFSAGLRVFLQLQKKANTQGFTMKIVNASDSVKQIFDIVGFSKIIDIK